MRKEYEIINKLKEIYGEIGDIKALSDNKSAYKKAIDNIKITCPNSDIILDSVSIEKYKIAASISFNNDICIFKIVKLNEKGNGFLKSETMMINNYKNSDIKEIEEFFKKTLFNNIPSHIIENSSPPTFH